MSKDHFYPAMKWHPETGENRVFHKAGDVPEGWLDTHPANLPKVADKPANLPKVADKPAPEAPKAAPAALDMTRKEIVAALTDGGIAYEPASKVVVLYELLTAEVKRVLTEAEIEFDAAAGTKSLLELLKKPE